MKSGRMYCLDDVLWIKNCKKSHYLLVVNGEEEYEISFGRQRKLKVPSECYIVSFAGDKFVLDKVKFEGGKCDYLKVLKDRNISYEIPKSLPNSTGHMYSRFECAVGAAWWAPCIQGYFGLNGYAITHIGYIGDD